MERTFITKRTSTKTGKEYTALIGVKNNKEYLLTFDKMTMLRLSNLTLQEYENIVVGQELEV